MPTTYPDYPHRHLYRQHAHADGYRFESGRFVLPLAEAEPETEEELADFVPFVEVVAHAPMVFRTVEFDNTKYGAPPQVPSPETAGAFTFLSGSLALPAPSLSANGFTNTWRVFGQYEFAVAGAASLAVDKGLVMQSLPMPTQQQRYLTNTYGQGNVDTGDLVLSQSGADVRAAYTEALTISFVSPAYTYFSTSLFPGTFFNEKLVVADTTFAVG